MVNIKNQAVRILIENSNLYALWKLDENTVEIEFYYNEIEQVYLHLAENPVQAKQVMNQLLTSVKRLLDQFRDVVA